jgi:anhydro-N-acetylmuramic acid kinase
MKVYRVIGLMSGTSLDGIDAALIETDGEGHIIRQAFLTEPYAEDLRGLLRGCLNRPYEQAREAEREMTFAHVRIVQKLLASQDLAAKDIDLIGFHGQTISHDPSRKHTCQIGDGALLAALTGIRVINDFRTADVLAGGQGAPLVPVYHQALASGLGKPLAFLNIGGVANVTYIGDQVMAFDTGAGNALIDDWVLTHKGEKYDRDGNLAAAGQVHEDILKQWMAHPFFSAKPPKSLDRNSFNVSTCKGLSPEDGAATLTAFTVAGILRALDYMPQKPKEWIVAGGGRLNKNIMAQLREKLAVPVRPIEDIGLDGDAIEAEAFAYMAVRSFRGLPISFPGTTGVPVPMVGGRLNQVPADAA